MPEEIKRFACCYINVILHGVANVYIPVLVLLILMLPILILVLLILMFPFLILVLPVPVLVLLILSLMSNTIDNTTTLIIYANTKSLPREKNPCL